MRRKLYSVSWGNLRSSGMSFSIIIEERNSENREDSFLRSESKGCICFDIETREGFWQRSYCCVRYLTASIFRRTLRMQVFRAKTWISESLQALLAICQVFLGHKIAHCRWFSDPLMNSVWHPWNTVYICLQNQFLVNLRHNFSLTSLLHG